MLDYTYVNYIIRLQKLSLLFKESFEFLNAFCFSHEEMKMFFARETGKIRWPIVVSNSVKVVNNPTIRKRFSICLLPNKNVLTNITCLVRSWVAPFENQNITKCSSVSSLPMSVSFTSSKIPVFHAGILPHFLNAATSASYAFMADSSSAIKTFLPPVFVIGFVIGKQFFSSFHIAYCTILLLRLQVDTVGKAGTGGAMWK